MPSYEPNTLSVRFECVTVNGEEFTTGTFWIKVRSLTSERTMKLDLIKHFNDRVAKGLRGDVTLLRIIDIRHQEMRLVDIPLRRVVRNVRRGSFRN